MPHGDPADEFCKKGKPPWLPAKRLNKTRNERMLYELYHGVGRRNGQYLNLGSPSHHITTFRNVHPRQRRRPVAKGTERRRAYWHSSLFGCRVNEFEVFTVAGEVKRLIGDMRMVGRTGMPALADRSTSMEERRLSGANNRSGGGSPQDSSFPLPCFPETRPRNRQR